MRRVPDSELVFSFVRSSGPGGQNVNKTSSKVQLRWNVDESRAFSRAEKERLKLSLKSRLNDRGELMLSSEQERSQTQNKQHVVQQLEELIKKAMTPTRPRKRTKPTRSSKERRLNSKRRQGEKKAARREID